MKNINPITGILHKYMFYRWYYDGHLNTFRRTIIVSRYWGMIFIQSAKILDSDEIVYEQDN